jgi:hypothetical protein
MRCLRSGLVAVFPRGLRRERFSRHGRLPPSITQPRRMAVALAVLLIAGAPAAAPAQTASPHNLKAGFLYNFAKFTEWPAEALPTGAPLVLCVADAAKVVKALEEATTGRDIEGHAVVVRTIELDGPVRTCHLLYADGLDAKRGARLIENLKGAPVLALSDFATFASMGGAANLFVEDGHMRFAVNLDAVLRNKLRLSSKLLTLAKIVKDDHNASPR